MASGGPRRGAFPIESAECSVYLPTSDRENDAASTKRCCSSAFPLENCRIYDYFLSHFIFLSFSGARAASYGIDAMLLIVLRGKSECFMRLTAAHDLLRPCHAMCSPVPSFDFNDNTFTIRTERDCFSRAHIASPPPFNCWRDEQQQKENRNPIGCTSNRDSRCTAVIARQRFVTREDNGQFTRQSTLHVFP